MQCVLSVKASSLRTEASVSLRQRGGSVTLGTAMTSPASMHALFAAAPVGALGERPSGFGLPPEELEAQGCPGSATHVFGRLQRPWTWADPTPALSQAAARWLLRGSSACARRRRSAARSSATNSSDRSTRRSPGQVL